MNYDLTRLGSGRFEHLVQALALANLGPGVQIFGAGPDGGREATFNGKVQMEGKAEWNGYGVIQAKYKERLETTHADQKWFFQQVTTELQSWVSRKKKRHRNQPDYLVIATNIPLTSVEENGGLDRLKQLIEHYRDLTEQLPPPDRGVRKIGMPRFKDYAIWHADYLDRTLEKNTEISRRYADLVLPGDVLSRLYDHVVQTDERVARAWIGHVARALKTDTPIELGESGDKVNTPLSLAAVAVDLPTIPSRSRNTSTRALKFLVDRADQVLAPNLRPPEHDRLVVLGGPGSGKSTLSRLLCQIYRVALIQKEAAGRVPQPTVEMAIKIRKALDEEGLPTPTLHRLPVRIVLSTFADAVSTNSKMTLLQHIVDQINLRASNPISVSGIESLMGVWPFLVVLDGLDEVASADNRAEVSGRIFDFLTEMAALQADVLTVCTSRPIGFERDDEIGYEELHLAPLTADDALHYASRLVKTRFPEDPDRQDTTLGRLREASRVVDTARLMTSPLQVTILSLLLEQRRRAPASRYALFKAYYEVIYARECGKPKGIGNLLETYRPQLEQLHQQCGLAIHARAEHAGEADSILPVTQLEATARQILEAEEHPDQDDLIAKILHLAQHRLVLLVPRQDGVAFEVRSLAEFFAARSLMSREDATNRLAQLVPSAHWRHTWLLAAGHVFSERLELRDQIIGTLDDVDHSSAVNRLVLPGALLALDALDDGFAAQTPRYEKKLIITALKLAEGPTGSHITRLADVLISCMTSSDDLRQTVWREIDASIADKKSGSLRALLNGIAAADLGPDGARATRLLEEYVTQAGSTPSAGSPDEERAASASLLAALIDAGYVESDAPSQQQIDDLSRKSFDGSESERWLLDAREAIVAGCRDNPHQRTRIRRLLADALQHDFVGESFSL
ncbi:NACHT domain-containing protein [Gordonia sp. KTR9]|uniref:NACHT domain-containing protein n=1 Tax=Gordonia sp. KTR9 TaxID=337191 RepID=UPI00027DE38A|nr:NTPase NACHT family [Gordonia sp. KTR9]AFR51419.1 putative NTPase, NACHT family [Gordonia sp. KTR9]